MPDAEGKKWALRYGGDMTILMSKSPGMSVWMDEASFFRRDIAEYALGLLQGASPAQP